MAKKKQKLTEREKDVRAAIQKASRGGIPPTFDEIGVMLGIPKYVVLRHCTSMREKGWIRWEPRKARTLQLI